MKYFGIFNNSGDVQTAINESALTKPYVALVSGALDYNTLEPQSANYIGEWFDAGDGSYYFDLLDAASFELAGVEIATSELYLNGDLTNVRFDLFRNEDGPGEYSWNVYIYPVEGDQSEGVYYTFYGEDTWEVNELKSPQAGDSDCLEVYFDGIMSFNFYDQSNTLSLNTINPVAPSGE